MQLEIILYLLVAHFIGDFILQSDYVAQNKSKFNSILLVHVALYTIPFIPVAVFLSPLLAAIFIIVNAAAHFTTDYFTSRLTSKLWASKQVHNFFVVIGLDQLLHIAALTTTFYYLQG